MPVPAGKLNRACLGMRLGHSRSEISVSDIDNGNEHGGHENDGDQGIHDPV
jgi:hypothetical protein